MKKFLLLLGFILGLQSMQSQIKFNARVSSKDITTDDRLRISFIAQGNTRDIYNSRIEPPSFEGFRAMGPFVSQEFSYINGSSFFKKSYTYSLEPIKTGKLVIGPALLKIDGKEYKTQPVIIQVSKGSQTVQVPAKTSSQEKTKISGKTGDIFLVAQVTKKNPYINEAVGLTYKLYIPKNYGVQNYQELSQPQYNGFWAQDLDRNISGPFQGEINGKAYEYYILKKKLLFPQQAGKLTVKPLTLSIDIQVPVIRQMGYFQIRDFETKRIKLSSGPKTINVRALPEKGKPMNFNGAVGQFDFFVYTDKNEVNNGEAANVTVGVKGIGNLKLFNLPELKAPEGLEVYDPTHTENVKPTFNGNKGEIQDKYIVIPNHSGKFIIPGMSFSYFNPQTNTYETKTTKEIVLFSNGENNYSSNQDNNSLGNIKGTDFRFIKEKQHSLDKNKKLFFKSKAFYVLTGLPFLIALILFLYKKYLNTRSIDENALRIKKRKSMAQRYLKEAAASIHNKDIFYANLEKAIHNFIKAKLKIDSSELAKNNIRKLLSDKGVDENNIEELLSLLNNCEMARYTPFGEVDMQNDLRRTEKILNTIDKLI